MTMNIDTLQFTKRLTDAGMKTEIAEALVIGLSKVEPQIDTSELVTKDYLNERFEAFEEKMNGKFEALEQRMTVRLGTMMIGGMGLVLLLSKLIETL